MQFWKPQMQLVENIVGRTSPHTHLSRWIQAYGMKPTLMHTILVVGDTISKQVWVRQWHEQPLWLGP